MSRRMVHLCDSAGRLIYDRMWDDGSHALRFDSGHGWVDKTDARRFYWEIRDGWAATVSSLQERSRSSE